MTVSGFAAGNVISAVGCDLEFDISAKLEGLADRSGSVTGDLAQSLVGVFIHYLQGALAREVKGNVIPAFLENYRHGSILGEPVYGVGIIFCRNLGSVDGEGLHRIALVGGKGDGHSLIRGDLDGFGGSVLYRGVFKSDSAVSGCTES